MESAGSIDSDMQELAKVVQTEAFRQLQQKFLEEHCKKEEHSQQEFEEIQNMYKSAMTEELTKQLGTAKIQKIQDGFDAYSKTER